VVLATKFGSDMGDGNTGAHPDYVRRAVDASLSRLGVDVIDLYQLHKPDPEVPLADTMGALDELAQAGKVREVGGSNLSVEQLREAAGAAEAKGLAPMVSVQNHYSLVEREPDRGVLEECARTGLAFLPYFPLASGLLTGKYRGDTKPEGARLSGGGRMSQSFLSERNVAVADALGDFAEQRGHSLLELAVSWLLARPAVVSVIAGATKVEQVTGNVAAAGWSLSADELAEVDRLAPVG
jgi:aryl-alcohol dehydrogenase-like predicted oxidoreductase